MELKFTFQIVQNLISLLLHPDYNIQTLTLTAIGTIATSNASHTQHILDCDVLKYLKTLLEEMPHENTLQKKFL